MGAVAPEVLQRLRRIVASIAHPAARRKLAAEPQAAFEWLGLSAPKPLGQLGMAPAPPRIDLCAERILGQSRAMDGGCAASGGVEVRLLRYGARPAVLLHGPDEELTRLAAESRRIGLIALLSPFEFLPVAGRGRGSFYDLAADPRPASGGAAWRGLVLALSEDLAILAWLALWLKWDSYLGQLLGYPHCCIEAFQRRWPAARDRYAGDVGAVLLAEEDPRPAQICAWPANVFARYLRPVITSHFPCSLNCPATTELGRRYYTVLARHEPRLAWRLRERLAQPVFVTPAEGVFLLTSAELEACDERAVVRYDATRVVGSDTSTRAARALLGAGELVVGPSSAGARIGSLTLEGSLLSFVISDYERERHEVPLGSVA